MSKEVEKKEFKKVSVYNKGQRKIIFKDGEVEKSLFAGRREQVSKEVAEHLQVLFPNELEIFE